MSGRPTRVLHLSDTHLMMRGRRHHDRVDTTAATRRVLVACAAVPTPDLVVVSGDVSEDGTVDSYAIARDVIGGWARARGAPVVFAMGNHDRRAAFRQVLGDGHLHAGTDARRDVPAPDSADVAVAEAPVDAVSWVGRLRVLTLDTSVPGAGYGRIEPAQLDWLRHQLRTPAPDGTVLVLHHPPLPPVTRLHTALQLTNPAALGEVIAGSDVRVVLAGHYHHPASGVLAGRLVVVAPAVANRTDTAVPWGTERAVRGSGACLVEFGAGSGPVATVHLVAAPDDGVEVFAYGPEAVEAIVALAGPPEACGVP